MSTIVLPLVGNKIKALHIPGLTGTNRDEQHKFTGQIVTIARMGTNSWTDADGYHDNATVPYAEFTNADGVKELFWVAKWDFVYEDTPAEPELTEDQRTIASLKTTIGDLQDMIRKLTHDIEVVIGQRMIAEAEERGWCDSFDNIVDLVNNQLTGCARLPERIQEFAVEVYVTGTISTLHTVMVTARSQDDADELVSDNPNEYFDADEVLTEYVSWNSFDSIEVNPA